MLLCWLHAYPRLHHLQYPRSFTQDCETTYSFDWPILPFLGWVCLALTLMSRVTYSHCLPNGGTEKAAEVVLTAAKPIGSQGFYCWNRAVVLLVLSIFHIIVIGPDFNGKYKLGGLSQWSQRSPARFRDSVPLRKFKEPERRVKESVWSHQRGGDVRKTLASIILEQLSKTWSCASQRLKSPETIPLFCQLLKENLTKVHWTF